MSRAKRFHSFDFIFVMLIITLIASIFILMSNDQSQSQKQQRQLVERTVYNSFVSALAQVKSNAMLLFQLQYHNETVLPLLDQANQDINSPKLLQRIKQNLYKKLQMQFNSSSQTFEHQQVYLINGDSLLDLGQYSSRDQYIEGNNVGLEKVLISKEPSFGLALKNGRYLYRYFFPVFNTSNDFIAVVEVSMPLTAIQQTLMNTNGVKSQYFLAKRALLPVKQKNKLYQKTVFSDEFLTSNNATKADIKQIILNSTYLTEIKHSLSLVEETKLMQLKRFSLNSSVAGLDGIVVFMPINDVDGYAIGGVVTFSPNIKLYISSGYNFFITIILILILLLTLLYTIRKSIVLYQLQLYYQHFLDALPLPIFIKGENNQYITANKAFYHFFNINKDSILDKKQSFENEPEALNVSIEDINKVGGMIEFEVEQLKENDDAIYKVCCYVSTQKSTLKQGFIGYIKDISEHRLLNSSLKSAKFEQTQVMDMLPFGVRIFDLEGRTTYVNRSLVKISGYKVGDLLNADCDSIFSCLQCNKSACPSHRGEGLVSKQAHHIETIKYNAKGEARTYEVVHHPYYSIDNELRGIIEITHDITAKKSLLDKNHELMLADELTGLLNYRGLISAGENYFRLAQRANKPFYALYIDIVGMCKINTEDGEKDSEQLLKAFVHILKQTFRETDLIARISGDEFVILMTDSEYHITDNGQFVRLDNNIKKFNSTHGIKCRLVIDTAIIEYQKQNHPSLLALINDAEKLVYERRLKGSLD